MLNQIENKKVTLGQVVYKRDDQQGWVLARVVGVSENYVTLELEDGQRIKQKSSTLLLRSEHSDLINVSNLTELTPINEATVLECLHQRFSYNQFYTLAGSTVVAINPFKDVDELYTMHKICKYYEHKNKEELEPHVYLVADKAYSCMKRELGCVNQSIIVSGESGAGKTVSAKHLLRYLTIVSTPEDAIDLNNSVPASVIERRVLDSNPLLEAFGNAATPRNDNSSRFGKFIQLQFHRNGNILGGIIQTYLLEKTRVVHQRPGENNFHIFYQLLALQKEPQIPDFLGPIKEEIQASRLECSLISKDENHSLLTTLNAMSEIGITPASQVAVFQTLLAILHLTTLKFLPQRDEESSGYSEDQDLSPAQLETVRAKEESARLLGVSPQNLHYSLLNRSIVSGDDSKSSRRSVFYKPVMVAEAESRRDCLAMLLYSKLFDWLVTFINHQIKVEYFDHNIGLLDIYGFESFEENSLEQLCINYANERLQQHYVMHFLHDLQMEYESEGIAWKCVPYTDNKLCVDALDGSTGVFGVLNEDVYLNRRSVDHQVCNRIIEACSNSQLVRKPHFGTYGNQFLITHFAGDVLYTVKDAVTKNKDNIPPELISLLHSSSNSFVLQLFSDYGSPSLETKASRVVKSHRKKTVLSSFKNSLDSLLAILSQSDVHYVRCIKPNTMSRQGEFDRAFVLQQLQACGTIQAVDICRRGYPAKMTYQDFARRYQVFTRMKDCLGKLFSSQSHSKTCRISVDFNEKNLSTFKGSFFLIVEEHLSKMQRTCSVLKEIENHQNLQRLCASILETVFEPYLLAGVEVQFGHNKIFLTQTQVEHLEEIRYRVIHHVVCLAQACWKGHLQRTRYHHIRNSVLMIQTSWRAHSQRRKFNEMQIAARVIQRGWSRHRLRRSLGALAKASRTVKRSLLKWVRRGKFKKSLEKLRLHKESKKTDKEEKSNIHVAFNENCEFLEFELSQATLNYPSTSNITTDVQHFIHAQSIQSPSLSNLYVDNEEGNPLETGLDKRVPLDLDGPDGIHDNTVGSGQWSEDSGVITQLESASGPDSTNTSDNNGSGQENVPGNLRHEMAENHTKHTLHATKRPRAVLTVHREANKNHGRKDEKEIRSPALKKKCMSGRDEGGGGDCNRSKGGRKREDLYVANGVVTCRRLTRSGYRFHVRSSVLKHGHRTHHSYLPHGLPDALPSDEEDSDSMRTLM
ncbi:hypothetical protein RRG08_005535 [Elysia crispata]|uniref:Myosin motor domain-containing protein n=1 Tax=Elysia crispata TaxID=231223 RepID=A0AAE1DA25_9GAST|nr:hypothetical protein RRG08_005535 [Elysia crispata]